MTALAEALLPDSAPVDKLEQLQKIDRDRNIDGWNVRLYFLSRHPGVLAGVAAVVLVLSLAVAWFVQKPLKEVLGLDDHSAKDLQAELAKPKPQMERVLALLPRVAHSFSESVPADVWIAAAPLSQPEKLVAQAYWASLHDWTGFEPSADLLYYAHYVRPLRFANELLGDHFAEHDQPEQAAIYYRREAKFSEAKSAREKLLRMLIDQRDRKQLREVANDPAFAPELKPEHRLYLAAVEQKWADLFAPLRELQVRILQPVPATLAAVAGLAWFLVALQGIQPPSLFSFRVFAPVFSVLLGMGSILPTLVTGLWMEETLGLRHSEDVIGNFFFFVGSVGVREEICKLALALPLLPICLLRKSRLEMLVCAGCVGLGFAIWENLQYFAGYGAAAAFPRFLTANFFHFALTGLNGLALYDLFSNPVRGTLRFLGTLLATIVAHGLYDFLASVPGMPVLAFGSLIVFMLVSLCFFRSLRLLRDGSTDQFSIAGTFVVGISVLTGTIIVLASHQIGLLPALFTLAATGFGMIMVGYMFYWQLGEGMSAVEEVSPSSYRV